MHAPLSHGILGQRFQCLYTCVCVSRIISKSWAVLIWRCAWDVLRISSFHPSDPLSSLSNQPVESHIKHTGPALARCCGLAHQSLSSSADDLCVPAILANR